MSFLRYEAYKDSGTEWLGDLPKHWGFAPLKRMFAIVGGSTPRSDDQNLWGGPIPWVTPADLSRIEAIYIAETARSISEAGLASCGTSVVPRGSIILSTRAPIGSIAIASMSLCTNQGCKSLVPVEESSSLFFYFLLYSAARELNIRGKGTTFLELSADELASLYIPVPSAAEQSAIAAFLDRETAKIDALVEEQQRLIALLEEKRQAVISHAVTKGLDANAPMKASGVEWLGEVPAHWQSLQLGRICTQVSDGPHFSPNYLDEGVMFISARNIRVNGWSFDDAKFISEEDYHEFCRRVIPEVGDVLYTKGGTTGVARVVDFNDRFQVWVHIAVLKINHDAADPYFVAYALNSICCYEQAQLFTRGATNNDLGLTRMIKIWLTLPTLVEQKSIVRCLDNETCKIDALIFDAQSAISLLQERRSALISAAVTGKIDVRGLAPQSAEAA